MLPSTDDMDRLVREAEAEVSRADAQVGTAVTVLKRRVRDRLPWIAGTAIAGLAAYLLVPRRDRHAPPAGGWYRRRQSMPWQSLARPLVNLLVSRGIGLLTAVVAALAARKPERPPATVPHVDLARYAGQWFEIARLPTRAESGCDRDVTATYEAQGSGLRIVNRCRRANGRMRSAVGHARLADGFNSARLQISFAPSFLDPIPFVWADYWVLDLADDYSAALVGTPDRKHLWLLSRTPTLPGTTLSNFIARAEQQGYRTADLQYTEHTVRFAQPRSTNGDGTISAQVPSPSISAESRAS
jgi:apolipoprotein D and lipocalin family protein